MNKSEYNKAYREKNKEKLREQKRRYYLKNREKFLFKASLFLQENREKILEYQKKYYLMNKDSKLLYAQEYASKNKEDIKNKKRAYYLNRRAYFLEKAKQYRESVKDTPEYKLTNRLKEQRRRARKREVSSFGNFTREEWVALIAKHKGRCVMCLQEKKLTVDHIFPLSKGGRNTIDNIQPLCKECNSSKGAKILP